VSCFSRKYAIHHYLLIRFPSYHFSAHLRPLFTVAVSSLSLDTLALLLRDFVCFRVLLLLLLLFFVFQFANALLLVIERMLSRYMSCRRLFCRYRRSDMCARHLHIFNQSSVVHFQGYRDPLSYINNKAKLYFSVIIIGSLSAFLRFRFCSASFKFDRHTHPHILIG